MQIDPLESIYSNTEMYTIPKHNVDIFTTVTGTSESDVKKIDRSKYENLLGVDGSSIGIAVIDTGVDIHHENLKSKVKKSMNFASDLKVCMETLNLKDTSRFDYFIRIINYCNTYRGKYDTYFRSYYNCVKSLCNFLNPNTFETFEIVFQKSVSEVNNISNQMSNLYYSEFNQFKNGNTLDLSQVYGKYLESFEYQGTLYYYENASNGNPCYQTHGTHVASISSGNNEQEYTGLAPSSYIFDLCVQSTAIESGLFFIQDALRWVSVHGKTNGIQLVNMSLGGTQPWGDTENIVNSILNQNIVILAATGNSQHNESGTDASHISYPAGYPDVIAIGSLGRLDSDQNVDYTVTSYYSEIGQNIDYTAPGRNIIAAESNTTNGYVSLSGTSMACPYACGVICLLLDYFNKNNIVIDNVRKLNWLLSKMTSEVSYVDLSNQRVSSKEFDIHTGYGRIEINFNNIDLMISERVSKCIESMPSNWKVENTR